jgi:hypothetical protein
MPPVVVSVKRSLSLWCRDGACYIFIKDGVFKLRIEDVSADSFVPFLWAFIDADERKGVPKRLAGHDTKLYIIFVTYPKRQRWSRLESCTNNMEIVMNPWFSEEIRQA